MMKRFNAHKITKVLLSLFLIYHVFVIAIYPNGTSYIRYAYGWIFNSYVNALGLNSAWSFYAPEPETAMYLEAELDQKGKVEVLTPETFRWPYFKTRFFDPYYNRRTTSMSFLSANSEYIKTLFIPWICRT